jgi:hypothetical protein
LTCRHAGFFGDSGKALLQTIGADVTGQNAIDADFG